MGSSKEKHKEPKSSRKKHSSTKKSKKKIRKEHKSTSKSKRTPSQEEFIKDIVCTRCSSNNHSTLRCPKIWRFYVERENAAINVQKRIVPMHTFYCYKCGLKGHLGDDCTSRKFTKDISSEDSAFAGKNLSVHLKEVYYECLQQQHHNNSADSGGSYHHRRTNHHFFAPPYKKFEGNVQYS